MGSPMGQPKERPTESSTADRMEHPKVNSKGSSTDHPTGYEKAFQTAKLTVDWMEISMVFPTVPLKVLPMEMGRRK